MELGKLSTSIEDIDKALEGGLKRDQLFCLIGGMPRVGPPKTMIMVKQHPGDSCKPIKMKALGIDHV